ENCGQATNKDSKIVGGVETKVNGFPWMVHIKIIRQAQRDLYCGGTVIKRQWLLSAAHCFTTVGYDKLIAVFGEHDYNSNNESSATEQEVKNVYVHPSFNKDN
ncbi:unnamed protein product, partial [Meganyctiphanes norvegica]